MWWNGQNEQMRCSGKKMQRNGLLNGQMWKILLMIHSNIRLIHLFIIAYSRFYHFVFQMFGVGHACEELEIFYSNTICIY